MSASRLDDLRMVDPILTTIAQEYTNDIFIRESLFPNVKVAKLKGKVPVFNKESFITRETLRGARAKSNRINPGEFDLVAFETKERDVEMSIDYLEEEETAEFLNYETKVTKQLIDILSLGKEKEAADLAQDTALYASDMKRAILVGEAFDDYSLTTLDPLTFIRAGMDAIRSKIAKFPNTMVMGITSYRALINHPKILARVKNSGVNKLNAAFLSELLEIPNIAVGTGVYSNDGTTFADIWSDNIILAYVDGNDAAKRSEYNPSYGYTFQREGKPEVDTYFENGGKLRIIRNTDNYGIKVTAQDAAYIISNTNHLS